MTDYHVSDSMLAIMESDEVTGSGFDQERRREVERMMARELRLLRAEVDFERKRVWTLIEEKDVVPGDDFRKQMAFDQERYEGACKRADQLREIGNNHAVNTQRERRRAEAAEMEVERIMAAFANGLCPKCGGALTVRGHSHVCDACKEVVAIS